MTISEIEKAVSSLSAAEKAKLSYKLLESIEKDADENLDQLWNAEVDSRYKQIQEGKAILKDASAVINEAKQKYE
jgi:hypothetical protein